MNPRSAVRFLLLWSFRFVLLLALLLAGPAYMFAFGEVQFDRDWRTMQREPAGLAPDAGQYRDAVVQVYAARAFNWRGVFAVHTWIAVKPENAESYTLYEVTGWRRPSVRAMSGAPDRPWFGSPPKLLGEIRGSDAHRAIPTIEAAVRDYPFAHRYEAWPGPNSNTFTAWVVRRTAELQVEFPPTAIGKDYLDQGLVARTPSGTGFQASLGGVLGLTIARREGLELNILGLVVGLDPLRPALKIPGIGRVGYGRPWTLPGEGPAD
ncbi:hypothetical protein J2T57_003092 [Natronocella acetinitrilica]|uniref:DUF3750 domain-containing protein n=1 Tax=Natronocella acetinitrilica TaxID=414046 RepID=A0AAE3KH37_9GAMM|nr:DUF3750 domain-containing protein [Natronocella acetinitrilica]MCP1675937.1 hypothetical protein [Natronocella acetinitrilica]